MINVNTLNGNYTLTESLFKMIKENNPELLMEDNSYIINMLKSRGVDINNVSNKQKQALLKDLYKKMPSNASSEDMKNFFDNYVKSFGSEEDRLNKIIGDPKQGELFSDKDKLGNKSEETTSKDDELNKKSSQEELFSDKDKLGNKSKKTVDDSVAELIIANIEDYGEESLKIDYADYDIDSWLKNEDNRKRYNDAIEAYEDNKNEESYRNELSNMKTSGFNPYDKALNNFTSMEDYLKSDNLIYEIKKLEESARKVIKRIKELVHEYIGNWGDAEYNYDDTTTNDIMKKYNNPMLNKISNNDNQFKSLPIKYFKSGGSDYKNLAGSYNNFSNDALFEDENALKKQTNKVSSLTKLAIGGFRLTPMITNKNDEVNKGKALKYYLSSLKYAKNNDKNNSLVKSMVMDVINIRELNMDITSHDKLSNVEQASRYVNKDIKYNNKEANEDLEKLCFDFLSKVVYKMDVNNNPNFQRIVDVIRYDPTLNDIVNITNNNAIKQFNTRETNMVFTSKNNDMPILILTIVPLFAQGQEILKNLKPVWGSLKQLKG